MKQNSSSRKLNNQAREVIAGILLFDVSDPRLRMVTVTGCEVSFDRSFCNVFYTCDAKSYAQVEEVLAKAKGHIRSLMARRLSWRVAPELRFILDESVDNAQRISDALNSDPIREIIAEQELAGDQELAGESEQAGEQEMAGELEMAAGAESEAGELEQATESEQAAENVGARPKDVAGDKAAVAAGARPEGD